MIVDESTYNSKTRLEFWIAIMNQEVRVLKYLKTIDMETNIDVEDFLKNDLKRSEDVRFANADVILHRQCF